MEKYENLINAGNLNGIITLVENGVTLEEINNILWLGAIHGHLKIVEYAITKGADIHFDENITITNCIQYERFEIADFLIEKGAYLENLDVLLYDSIRNGKLKTVMYLVGIGTRIDAHLVLTSFIHGDIAEYLLLHCSIEQLKIVISKIGINYHVINIIKKYNFIEYQNLINACMELGIDIYDMIEKEMFY